MNAMEELLSKEHMVLKECKHGHMLFNKNDLFIGQSLSLYGEWCEAELELLKKYVKSGDVVLDVGANIGTHTLAFSKMVSPGGLVYAFEPQVLVFQNLCANVALNAVTNVYCKHKAIGKEKGKIFVPVMDWREQQNFGALRLGEYDQGEQVELTTIDSIGLKKCELIKIDVEGMELEVLEGAKETIRKFKPILFLENNSDSSKEIITKLLSMGYDAYWHISGYYNAQNHFSNKENIFQSYRPEINLLCFPEPHECGLPRVQGIEDSWNDAQKRIKA